MSDRIDLDKFPTSETALRMLHNVSPIYQNSYYGKWLYQVMGLELDDVWKVVKELREQAFTQTVTWGIEMQELKYSIEPNDNLSLAERRARLYRKKVQKFPISPGRLENYIKNTWDVDVDLDETYAPGVFLIEIQRDDEGNLHAMLKDLKEIKPSHLSWSLLYRANIEDDFSLDHVTDESILDVLSGFKDVVPYGRAKEHLHYDGKWQYLDGYHYKDFQYGDKWQYSHIILPGSVQYEPYTGWQFAFDGVAQYDGTWQYDSSYIYNGERPWVVLYNDFMDELSVLVITMQRPDGSTELQDDIAARLTYGERVPYGARRIGVNPLPIDCGGYLKVTRAHPYSDTWQYGDAGHPKYNGNVQFGDGWQYSKGGVHYGIDTFITTISGDLVVVDPKLIEPPYGERFPEIEETVHANDAAEQAVLDLGAFVSEHADRHALSYGEMRYGNYASVGTENPLPVDNGGELEILKGHPYGAGRRYDYGVSTVYGDGMTYATMQFEGGETYAPRRYSAVL